MASNMTKTNTPPPPRVYVGFKPKVEISEDSTVIKIHFPGFKKEQLQIQHIKTTPGKLRITGERHAHRDKWLKTEEEFLISPDCDTGKIKAVFQSGGILSVTLPKKTASETEKQQEGTREQRESGQEQAKGQTSSTSQASKKVAPESSKPQETRQESNKKAEEQENSKPMDPQGKGKAVSEEVPKPEEPKSHTQQAKPAEPKDAKSVTGRSSDDAKSSSAIKEGSASQITKNATSTEGYEYGTFAEMKSRRYEKTMNLVLVVLAVIGIGLYVKNIYDY